MVTGWERGNNRRFHGNLIAFQSRYCNQKLKSYARLDSSMLNFGGAGHEVNNDRKYTVKCGKQPRNLSALPLAKQVRTGLRIQ